MPAENRMVFGVELGAEQPLVVLQRQLVGDDAAAEPPERVDQQQHVGNEEQRGDEPDRDRGRERGPERRAARGSGRGAWGAQSPTQRALLDRPGEGHRGAAVARRAGGHVGHQPPAARQGRRAPGAPSRRRPRRPRCRSTVFCPAGRRPSVDQSIASGRTVSQASRPAATARRRSAPRRVTSPTRSVVTPPPLSTTVPGSRLVSPMKSAT